MFSIIKNPLHRNVLITKTKLIYFLLDLSGFFIALCTFCWQSKPKYAVMALYIVVISYVLLVRP